MYSGQCVRVYLLDLELKLEDENLQKQVPEVGGVTNMAKEKKMLKNRM